MKETAVEHYRSRQGNCAQSVAMAWTAKGAGDFSIDAELSSHGGGRAPEGMCGALYAATLLAGDHEESVTNEFKGFSDGLIGCREIRKVKKLSCIQCVGIAAALLEKHNG